MKKFIKTSAIILGIASCLSCSVISASATTVDDVIAHAYEVGMSEDLIQQYISMGSGREWTSEQCDQAIAELDKWKKNIDNVIGDGDTNNPTKNEPKPIEPGKFQQMDIEDKKDYIQKLPSEKKEEYIGLMTNGEKHQLIKELDTTQQLEVISGMLGFGDAFGYSFSIENASDGSFMISARDENNKLVGLTILGDSIEKTGITYTVPILTAGGLILLSVAGMAVAIGKSRLKNEK